MLSYMFSCAREIETGLEFSGSTLAKIWNVYILIKTISNQIASKNC